MTYRVKQAAELMGRRVNHGPIELVCALTLAATLGAAVLADGIALAEPDQRLVVRPERAAETVAAPVGRGAGRP